MKELIEKALLKVGAEQLPTDINQDLAVCGVDSLMVALLYSELETQLKMGLNPTHLKEDSFTTIQNIINFVEAAQR